MAIKVVQLAGDGGLSEVSVPAVGATVPGAPGAASAGTSADAARADHVHPPGLAVGFRTHGDVDNVPRPAGYARVLWFGSVEPLGALENDLWIVTD